MLSLQLSPLEMSALASSRIESKMASIPEVSRNAPTSVLVTTLRRWKGLDDRMCLRTGGRRVIIAAKRMRTVGRPERRRSLPRHPFGMGLFFVGVEWSWE